jgi:hypothetical protein
MMKSVKTLTAEEQYVLGAIKNGKGRAAGIVLFTNFTEREVDRNLQRLRRKGLIRFGRASALWVVCR